MGKDKETGTIAIDSKLPRLEIMTEEACVKMRVAAMDRTDVTSAWSALKTDEQVASVVIDEMEGFLSLWAAVASACPE